MSEDDNDTSVSTDRLDDAGAADAPLLATRTIGQIEAAATILSVDEPETALHAWLDLTDVLLARARQVRQMIESLAIEWISANGPTHFGDITYTVGYPKTVRCTDAVRCLGLVLDACGGDLDAAVAYLRSDPFKYGSIRNLLGEPVYAEMFKTETKPKLVEGKPQKELVKIDTRFLPSSKKR
jgi:hypothetical protein